MKKLTLLTTLNALVKILYSMLFIVIYAYTILSNSQSADHIMAIFTIEPQSRKVPIYQLYCEILLSIPVIVDYIGRVWLILRLNIAFSVNLIDNNIAQYN